MKIRNSSHKKISSIQLRSLLGAAILSSSIAIAEHRHCEESLFTHPLSNKAESIKPLDNQQHPERKAIIGGHIIGSLFSVVNEVDKLGGNAVKLISGSVGKINKLASKKSDLEKINISKKEYRDSVENTIDAEALSRELVEQLILSGQLETLLASIYALPINNDMNGQQGIDAKPAANPTINHHSNSIQCPLRTRPITM
jgi:hypothetical protein